VWIEYVASMLQIPIQVEAYGGAQSGYGGITQGSKGMRAQIDAYLAKHPLGVDRRALHVLFGGVNDLNRLTKGVSENEMVSQVANNIATAVTQLAVAGAEQTLVIGAPNVGLTPFALSAGAETSARLSRLSRRLNQATRNALDATGVPVRFVDVYPLLGVIQSAPEAFGLSNAKHACLPRKCRDPNLFLFVDGSHLTTKGHRLLAEFMIRETSEIDL